MDKINLNDLCSLGAFDIFNNFRFKDYNLAPWKNLKEEELEPLNVILFEGTGDYQGLLKERYNKCKSVYLLTDSQISNFNRQIFLNSKPFNVAKIVYSNRHEDHFHEFPIYRTIGINKTQLETYNSLGISELTAVGAEDLRRIFKNFK